jgi:hypothetical protein
MPTERPLLVGEVSANVCGYKVPRGQRDVSLRPFSQLSRPESNNTSFTEIQEREMFMFG